ncbi:glycerophosphodiester phosphodiesterase family protein [Psychroflexus sp. MBR-150]
MKRNLNITTKAFQNLFFLLFIALQVQAQITTRLDSILHVFNNEPEEILVMAHRSAHQNYPENSIAAMKESIRLGVDIIELDLRQTKDGKLIIMHDATVDRTTDGTGEVSSFTLDELKKLHLLFNEKPTNQAVPTFDEVLKLTKDKIMIDVDFKLDDKEAVVKTFKLIEKHNAEKQVLFFLHNFRYFPHIHKLNPEIKIMPRAYSTCDVEDMLKYDDIKIVHIDHDFYNDYLMKKMAYKGMRILVKTMGDIDDLELQEKGSGFEKVLNEKYVNVIQTDLPEELLAFLKSKNLHR